jgi:hypothetical protein
MNRVQRKRTKGYKLPKNTKCVNRGTKWGNPIKLIGDMIYINAKYRRTILDPWVYYNVGDIDDVIYLYKKLWDGTKFQNPDLQYWADLFSELDLKEIEGKNLACFCSLSAPCHADVLIELAKRSACV